jgi:hypothetical protein
VLLLRGDSAKTLESEEVQGWLRRARKLSAKVKLFLADRPFNCLTEGGGRLRFDDLTQQGAIDIAAAEKKLASHKARFLSRVGKDTLVDWITAYKQQNLNFHDSVFVARDGNACRGIRLKGHDTKSSYMYVAFLHALTDLLALHSAV